MSWYYQLSRISLEMVYRGLYHFTVAYDKGKATDPVKYFAAPQNQDLRVVKTQRKPVEQLNLSPSPGSERSPMKAHKQTPLTNCSSP